MDVACFGADGDGSSLECPQAVGGVPKWKVCTWVTLARVTSMRLTGINGGKLSGLPGQVWGGSSDDLHKGSKALKKSLPGKVAGEGGSRKGPRFLLFRALR